MCCEDIITNYHVIEQKILENYVKNKNKKNKPLDAMFGFIMQVKPHYASNAGIMVLYTYSYGTYNITN